MIDKTYLYQINVTRDCNLRCTHCYIHSDVKASSKKMTEINLIKIANDIKEHMNKIRYQRAEIHIVGGEPTMLGLEFFKEVVPKIRNILNGNPFSYELMLISNLLHKDIVNIAKLFDRVTTSYEVDSRFVSLKGVFKPKLERDWISSVQNLINNDIEVGVTTAITKPVVNFGASKLLDFFYGINIKQIHFGFFIPEGDGLINSLEMFPNFKETSNFLIESAKWYLDKRDSDPKLFVNPFESMVGAIYKNEPLDDIVCPIIPGSLDINWDGNVATCLEAGGSNNPEWLGDIFSNSIIEVTTSQKFLAKVIEASKPQKICRTCEYYNVCKSGCGVLFKFFDPTLDEECPGFKKFIEYTYEQVNSGLSPKYHTYIGKNC